MKLVIGTQEEACAQAAQRYVNLLNAKPNAVLGLATGSTPLGLYADLAKLCAEGKLSFADCTTFNLDEYVGLDGTHEQSYRYFMDHNLFSKVDVKMERTHVPSGSVKDDAEAAEYDRLIDEAGGIDLQLLGIGHDGHIGFNEPGDFFPPCTHDVTLTAQTREANKRFFASLDEVPLRAYTMGVGTVMAARKIVILITGADKADILQRAFFAPVTPQVPASVLQFHHDVTLICDRAAAGR